MRVAGASLDRGCGRARLGARLCAGVAVGVGGQLGDASLGASSVPGGGATGSSPARRGLRRLELLMVPGPPQRLPGVEALLRVRRLQAGARRRQRALPAAGHRRDSDAGPRRAGDPADGHRKVALLSDPGAVPLRQDGRLDRGDIASGRPHGRPGGRTSEARDHLVRHDQRAPVDARAGRGAGEGAAGRRRHPVDIPGAVAQHAHAPGTAAARDRCLGARRGPLPVEVGPRLPSRLPLRGALHP